MSAHIHHPANLPDGVWQGLLAHAFRLVDEIAQHGIAQPFWTFGGGTVLMLRYPPVLPHIILLPFASRVVLPGRFDVLAFVIIFSIYRDDKAAAEAAALSLYGMVFTVPLLN